MDHIFPDDPTTRLNAISLNIFQNTHSESKKSTAIREMFGILTENPSNWELIEIFNEKLSSILKHGNLPLQFVLKEMERGFQAVCTSTYPLSDCLLQQLLELLESEDSAVTSYTDSLLKLLTSKTENPGFISTIINFHEGNPDRFEYTLNYIKNSAHLDLSDVLDYLKTYFRLALNYSYGDIVSSILKAYKIFSKLHPTLIDPKIERIIEKKKSLIKNIILKDKLSMYGIVKNGKKDGTQSETSNDTNYTLSSLGIEIEKTNQCDIPQIFEELDRIYHKLTDFKNFIHKLEDKSILIDYLIDKLKIQETQPKAIDCLELIVPDSLEETNQILKGILEVPPSSEISKYISMIIQAKFHKYPLFFIQIALKPCFLEHYAEKCEEILNVLENDELAQVVLNESGGIQMLLNVPEHNGFITRVLMLLMSYGISSKELELLLTLMKNSSQYGGLLLKLSEQLTYKNIEHGRYIDKPSSYFLVGKNNFTTFFVKEETPRKTISIMFWFKPKKLLKKAAFLEIKGKKKPFSIIVDDTHILVKHDKKESECLKDVVVPGNWNSFVLSFKKSKSLFGSKLKCNIYCNGKQKSIIVNNQYDCYKTIIGNHHHKLLFEGFITKIIVFDEFFSDSLVNAYSDKISCVRPSAFQGIIRIQKEMLPANVLVHIDPSEPNRNCRAANITSAAEAFKALGGLTRVFQLLENNLNAFETIDSLLYLSQSLHFPSLLCPNFFGYFGLLISGLEIFQIDYVLNFAKQLKANVPALSTEIIEGLVLNKEIWSKTTAYSSEEVIGSIKAMESPSLGRVYAIFNSSITDASLLAKIYLTVLTDDRNREKFNTNALSLLFDLQKDEHKQQVFYQLLVGLEPFKKKFDMNFRVKAAKLLNKAKDPDTELRILRLIWANRSSQILRMGQDNLRLERGVSDLISKEIIDSINRELPLRAINAETFDYVLSKVHINCDNNQSLLNVITSRLWYNEDVLHFLRILKEKCLIEKFLAQEILSVDYPEWISDILIKNYDNLEIRFEVFEMVMNSLLLQENLKTKHLDRVRHFLSSIIDQEDVVYEWFFFMLKGLRPKIEEKKLLFLGLIGVLEDLLTDYQCAYVKMHLQRFTELITQLTDLGLNIKIGSKPRFPDLSLEYFHSENKNSFSFNHNKLYLKEGGFIRPMIRFNLIGLHFEDSPVFASNLQKVMELVLSTDQANDKNETSGFSTPFGYPEVHDWFSNAEWVSTYIMTETVEVLFNDSVDLSHSLIEFVQWLLDRVQIFSSSFFNQVSVSDSELNHINSNDFFISALGIKNRSLTSLKIPKQFTRNALKADLKQLKTMISYTTGSAQDIINILFFSNDNFYIRNIHLYFLGTICTKLRIVNSFSRERGDMKPKVSLFSNPVISVPFSIPYMETDDDQTLREIHIRASLRRFLKIQNSPNVLPPSAELVQVRNRFDMLGRRFLLKPEKEKPQMEEMKFSKDQFCVEKVFDCEHIKTEGSYLGFLVLTCNYILIQRTGKTSCSYKGSAPEFTRSPSTKHSVSAIDDIYKVLPRRYLLQHTAVELFFYSRKSVMVNLFTEEARQLFYAFIYRHWDRKVEIYDLEMAKSLKCMLCRQWQQREISNTAYLMHLNSLASRSYHDMSQYPIFPSVISDYVSQTLDPSQLSSLRKLEYPIGAQTEEMREQSNFRYQAWSDTSIRAFHYGTHYSTAGSIGYYMFRLEPFTSQAKNLQGGKLDLGDRLFTSLDNAWKSSQCQIGDVKELIPELFYLPEMFINKGSAPYAYKQDKSPVNGLVLPIWAHSYLDLIVKMSIAIESKLASEKLNNWIDLIFGYKQEGENAVKACNLFYETSYESSHAEAMKHASPEEQEKLVSFVANFGQTPMKLFEKKHPKLLKSEHTSSFEFLELKETQSLMKFFQFSNDVVATCNYPKRWTMTKVDLVHRSTVTIKDFKQDQPPPEKISKYFDCPEMIYSHTKENVCMLNKYIIKGGYIDSSFKVFKLNGEYIRSVFYHSSLVNVVGASNSYLFTASIDSCIVSWKMQEKHLSVHKNYKGHDSPILSIAVMESFSLVGTLALSGCVLIHEIMTGECLRRLDDQGQVRLLPTQFGFFLNIGADFIRAFTPNGYEERYCFDEGIIDAECFEDKLVVVRENEIVVYKLFQREPVSEMKDVSYLGILTIEEKVIIFYSSGNPNALNSL